MARRTRGAAPTTPVQSRSGAGQFAREQPLLTAVLCVAFGIVLGCLFRMTPEEHEFLEEQTDKLKDQAGRFKNSVSDLASEGYQKARQFAERAVDAASDTVKGAADQVTGEARSTLNETAGASHPRDTGTDGSNSL